jgi:hypothetical protein
MLKLFLLFFLQSVEVKEIVVEKNEDLQLWLSDSEPSFESLQLTDTTRNISIKIIANQTEVSPTTFHKKKRP